MPLTPAQLSALKSHLAANTNTIGGVAINALPDNPDANIAVAAWYNSGALSNDAQNFAAPLYVWNPSVTIDQLTSAISWAQDPAGADSAAKTLAILKWQSMCWNNKIDMTDNQNRAGIAAIWGNPSASNTNLKSIGIGRKNATRFEMLLAGPARGPNGAAADPNNDLNGRITPVYGQLLTPSDIEAARNA